MKWGLAHVNTRPDLTDFVFLTVSSLRNGSSAIYNAIPSFVFGRLRFRTDSQGKGTRMQCWSVLGVDPETMLLLDTYDPWFSRDDEFLWVCGDHEDDADIRSKVISLVRFLCNGILIVILAGRVWDEVLGNGQQVLFSGPTASSPW